MESIIRLGLGHWMLPVPRVLWRRRIVQKAQHIQAGLTFMATEHHHVRNFVVSGLARQGGPLPPEMIAQSLGLPLARVEEILADLERHMTFLFRDGQGAVTWAYPVTAEVTPHQVEFSSGERVYAA